MRLIEVLLPATEDEVEKVVTSSEVEDKLPEFAPSEQVEDTLLDAVEDTIDASEDDAELKLSRLLDTAELQTSYSELKELPLENILADDEELENLLDAGRHQMTDLCVLIL